MVMNHNVSVEEIELLHSFSNHWLALCKLEISIFCSFVSLRMQTS